MEAFFDLSTLVIALVVCGFIFAFYSKERQKEAFKKAALFAVVIFVFVYFEDTPLLKFYHEHVLEIFPIFFILIIGLSYLKNHSDKAK